MRRFSPLLLPLVTGCVEPPPVCPAASLHVVESAPSGLLDKVALASEASGASGFVGISEALLSEGDRAGDFFAPPAKACFVVYARATEGVRDLDLFVFGDDGSALASDEGGSAQGAIMICPPFPERVFASARVASGAGRVAIGAHSVPVDRAVAVAGAVNARVPGEESGRLESWPGLELKLAAHRKRLGANWEDIRRFATVVDPRAATRATVPIAAQTCIDVLAVPSEEVPSLELMVEGESGRVVARGEAHGRDRALVMCSELGESVTLVLRPRNTSGHVALIVGKSRGLIAPELASSVVVRRATPKGTAEAAREAFEAELGDLWGKPSAVGKGVAVVGARVSVPVKLPAGCSRIDVHAGEPLGPFDVGLWTNDGVLLGESAAGLRATVVACTDKPVEARLDVGSEGRPGPFVAERRTLATPPAALLAHPLAVARLFERLRGLDEPTPIELATAVAVELPARRRLDTTFELVAGECLEPVVALDDETSGGIDLRLVNEASSDNILGRGRFVASQRLCLGEAARVRLELRADHGPQKGLLLVRRSKP